MKLTVQQRSEASGLIAPWSTVFHAPGGTIGRSAEAHLTLPDSARDICRIQAAVRISDNACYLVNLSGMSQVSINGRAILLHQEVPLSPGDELRIGSYTLTAEDPRAAAADATANAGMATGFAALHEPDPLLIEPDPLLESPLIDVQSTVVESAPRVEAEPLADDVPASQVAAADAPPAEVPVVSEPVPDLPTEEPLSAPHAFDPLPEDAVASDAPLASDPALDEPLIADAPPSQTDDIDVFSDLFGPGTLPVGSVPDVSAHPFDMESAQNRNPEDPLRHLPRGDANVSGPTRDPLDLLGSAHDDDVHNVFSDQTPSTLPSHDPLAPHRRDPVSDTLRQEQDDGQTGWAARDHLRETGGYLRPSRVQSPATKTSPTDANKHTLPRK